MAAAWADLAALGSTALLWTTDDAALADATAELVRELDAVDRACSRFRDDSELVQLNHAEGKRFGAGPYLFDAVQVALRAAAATGGLVDPTIGRGLRLAGYDRTFAIIGRRDQGTVRFVPAAGWRLVELDEDRRSIRIPSGVELDLGATAKALAADRAAVAAAEKTGAGILVDDARGFVDAVVRLLSDEQARAGFAAAARRAGRDLDWNVLARRYADEVLDRFL